MPGAGALEVGRHVGGTADVPVVARDAVPDSHAPVASAVDDEHLIVSGARRVERLPLAELSSSCVHKQLPSSRNAANYDISLILRGDVM